MNCSPNDLKDYLFGEPGGAERGLVEAHLKECAPCREEFERLRLTESALHTLHEEEPPRRIAFVSDKVFEPRWWRVWWNSGPRLGFASAAALSLAIVVHGVGRPAAAPPTDAAAIEARISAEVARRLEPAVKAAVAQSEARQAQRAEAMVAAVKNDLDLKREADRLQMVEYVRYIQKKLSVYQIASADRGALP
jgi:anti-sigma factor RsiW